MARPPRPRIWRRFAGVVVSSLLSTLLLLPGEAAAEDARIASMPDAPAWQLDSLMHLQLTAPETEAAQLTYSVYPLTETAGLNLTEMLRSEIWLRGSLVPAEDPSNAERLRSSETIAFLNCDPENATQSINAVMADKPRAILLYSLDGNCCSLQGDNLSFGYIYTMADSGEARDTMNNTDRAGGVLRATITGNTNVTSTPDDDQEHNGNNSAVAMSILYSITGLITLLFLVIIGTGAIRAHRYPERYGPRSGYGGGTRQSRAKGLARAVLETLPIVKFGDPVPAKPDPALELESHPSGAAIDAGMGTRLSAIAEEPRSPQARQSAAPPMSGAVAQPEVIAEEGQADGAAASSPDKAGATTDVRPMEENLGCSICTEDFTVGEDVRVLPCHHKFHPPCIDPWLINISGTCPLCRLDLRPQDEQPPSTNNNLIDPDDPFLIAPPLAASSDLNDHNDDQTTITTPHRRRSSRFIDLHRLRYATSVEERVEILRRHRSQQQQREEQQRREWRRSGAGQGDAADGAGGEESEEQRGRRAAAARLAERLRERFRIRTGRMGMGMVGSGPSSPTTATTTTFGSGVRASTAAAAGSAGV